MSTDVQFGRGDSASGEEDMGSCWLAAVLCKRRCKRIRMHSSADHRREPSYGALDASSDG